MICQLELVVANYSWHAFRRRMTSCTSVTPAHAIVAQVMFTIYRNAINNTITELNVSANLGTAMFSFSWTATLAALLAFFGFLIGICCGTGRRRNSATREMYDAVPPARY